MDSHTSRGTIVPDTWTNDVDRLFREHNAALLRFVLTNHPRASITMDGGTTFHFVAEGIHAALKRAAEAANGRDVRLGGGVATIRQYLRAGLVDEMHLAIAPTLLGSGEHLFAGLDAAELGYRCMEHVPTPSATHVVITRAA